MPPRLDAIAAAPELEDPANPFSREHLAWKARTAVQLSAAYETAGKPLRAAAVTFCGLVGQTGHSPHDGSLLRSRKGVPTAGVHKCGSRLCPSCARDVARRQRRRIVERLRELDERTVRSGPIRHKVRARPRPAVEVASELEHAWREEAYDVEARRPLRVRRAKLVRRRCQRRPRRGQPLHVELPGALRIDAHARVVASGLVGPDGAPVFRVVEQLGAVVRGVSLKRRTRESFRIGLPTSRDAYGCRFLTLTQPDRPIAFEGLSGSIERLEDAIARLIRSQVWRAHVDAAVIRIEFELSTPAKRRRRAAELAAAGELERARELLSRPTGTWWHVHAHCLLWGTPWPQPPSSRCSRPAHELAGGAVLLEELAGDERCACTRCAGVDDEDSLLMCWRRALVETGRYREELARDDIDQGELLRELRWQSHPSRRTWARALGARTRRLQLAGGGVLVDERKAVKIGGAHIKTPSRTRGAAGLSPWGALCEVVKYSTKPIALSTMPLERVVEIIGAIEGRRLVRCTGLLYGVDVVEDDDDKEREDVEGLDEELDAGELAGTKVAYDAAGRRVLEPDIVWRVADDDAIEERRRALYELHAQQRLTPRKEGGHVRRRRVDQTRTVSARA